MKKIISELFRKGKLLFGIFILAQSLSPLIASAQTITLKEPQLVSLQTAEYKFDVEQPGLYRLLIKGRIPLYLEIKLDGGLLYGLESESWHTRKHLTKQIKKEGKNKLDRWLYENVWLDKGSHTLRIDISYHQFTKVVDKKWVLCGFDDFDLSFESIPEDVPPIETLAVHERNREDMVFAKGEPLILDIAQRTKNKVEYTVSVTPQRPEGGYTPWRKTLNLPGNQSRAKATVEYPCDQEGVFEYRILDSDDKTIFGPWAFCVIDPTPLPLPKVGEKIENSKMLLVDKVVCADEDDNSHMFRDNDTSRIVKGQNSTYRIVGPQTAHSVKYTKDEKSPGKVRIAKTGEKPQPYLDRFGAFDWFAYSLKVKHAGKPHLLRVNIPTDVKRKVVVSVIDPVTRGINTGVFEVSPDLGSDPIASFELVCWPNASWVDVMVANLRSHMDTSNSQGAVSSFELLEAPDDLPPLPEAAEGWDSKREFGYTIEQRNLGTERFTMTKWWDGVEMPDQTIVDRTFGGRDLKSMYQSWERCARYARHLGDNFIQYGARTYFMDMFRTPHFPSGTDPYADGWKRRYVDRYPRDLMKMAMMLASKYNARIVVDQHINLQMKHLLPEFVMLEDRKKEHNINEVFLVNDEGSLSPGRYSAVLNPANPLARYYLKLMHAEIAEKFGKYPAFAGVNIRTWLSSSISGYFKNANLGYDSATVGHFCEENHIDMPIIPKSDPDQYRKRREWLKENCWEKWLDWRVEQVASLRKEINEEIKKYAPQARLYSDESYLSEEKDGGLFKERFDKKRELGYVSSKSIGGFGVEFNHGDPTCFAKLDVRPGVEKINMKNIKYRQISYFTDIVTGAGCAVRNAPNDVRKGVDALAEGNVDLFLMGGTWSPPSITKRRSDFVQTFRAIPSIKYKKLNTTSPVSCWYGQNNDELIVYLVNQSFYPQAVEFSFDGEHVECFDRVTGDKIKNDDSILVKACMLRVLTIKNSPKIEKMTTLYSADYLSTLKTFVDNLKRIIEKSHGMSHNFRGVGDEFIIKTLTVRETRNGEWEREDRNMTASECFAPALKAWNGKNYLATERALEEIIEKYIWWYEAFGWPENGYVHTMPKGRYATPEAMLKANGAKGEIKSFDGVPGESFVIPSGEACFPCDNQVPYSADFKAYLLSGKGFGPVTVLLDGKPIGTLGVADGKPAFGRFTMENTIPAFPGSKLVLKAPAGAPLVLKAAEFEEAEPTLIKKWMGVGNFDKANETRGSEAAVDEGMNKVFPPETEKTFSVDQKYEGMGGKKIAWKKIDIGDDKFIQMIEKYFPYDYKGKFNGVAYLTCWVYSPSNRPVTLYLAADWFYKVWINGENIIDDGQGPWGYFKPYPASLEKGWNRLLVKSACGSASWKQNVAISNPGDLKFSIEPPEAEGRRRKAEGR